MAKKDALIAELANEGANTRKMLERVPQESLNWQPHEKSMTIGRLASHIAEIPVWITRALEADQFDFSTAVLSRTVYPDQAALLQVFDERQAAAKSALLLATDEILQAGFVIKRGEQTIYQMPRQVLIRNFALNHTLHHRGQLSVYLRLLGIAVPGMYGPSADEK